MQSRSLKDKLGVCQWFHYEDYQAVETAVELMRWLGIKHLRTGVSWADYHRDGGRHWYRWQMEQFKEFDVLLSVWHTPPSIAEGACCAGPPLRLQEYSWFLDQLIDQFGSRFSHFELWNEPNNRLKWDFVRYDPQWQKFSEMIRYAAELCSDRGVPTVLGGMIPVDHQWLQLLQQQGALDAVDILAIHGFPNMWWSDQPNWDWYRDWQGWEAKIQYIKQYTNKPIWVTETGLATWDFENAKVSRLGLQRMMLRDAAAAPTERLYWYSLIDLAADRDAIEGFHVDENEYHLGLFDEHYRPKPAVSMMKQLLQGPRRGSAAQVMVHTITR